MRARPSRVLQAARDQVHRRCEVPFLLRLLALPPTSRVLEIGCGQGLALAVLRRRGLQVVGVDLERCAADVVADACQLPFHDASFDLVLDFGVVQHLPDGAAAALQEIARVLVPGGRYVHETAAAQLLAHPFRYRRAPLAVPPELVAARRWAFWSSRTSVPTVVR